MLDRACAASCRYLASSPDAPDHAARIDALAAIPEQIVRFLAERLEQGIPEREPMLEVLIRRHYREHELHDLRTLDRRPAGRSSCATTALDDRPTHLVTTAGHASTSWPTRRRGPVWSRAWPRRSRPRRRVTSRSSTSTCPGRGAPQSPDEASARLAELLVVGAVRAAGTPRRGRRLPRRRPPGHLLLVPARAGRGRRGRPGPRRAPDGRAPAQPVAAARLPDHPAGRARGRAALPLRRQGQRGRPAARRARPGAPARRRARPGRRGRRRCRTPSGPWPTAWRRSAGPAPHRSRRRPARHEPRVAAHLAGDRRPARASSPRCSARSRR